MYSDCGGGFAADNATLTRFFALHLLFLGLSMIHLGLFHTTGSNNPLGLNRNTAKSPFPPYFFYKNFLGIRIILFFYGYNLSSTPNMG